MSWGSSNWPGPLPVSPQETRTSPEGLRRQVAEIGCAVAGQGPRIVPADGAIYALRDATATVASVPLVAASVMAKKLAVASDLVVLDVKSGNGAFVNPVRVHASMPPGDK